MHEKAKNTGGEKTGQILYGLANIFNINIDIYIGLFQTY